MVKELYKITAHQGYELLWQKKFLSIYFNFDGKYLYANWSGLPRKELIMEGCEQILHFVETLQCQKIINDITHVEGIFTESVDWIVNDFAPRLNGAGISYSAWIYAANSVSRFSADAVLRKSITDTISIVFDNLENAERWVRAV